MGIFYSVICAGLHLWFEQSECLQQHQHLYILLSSICAPDWKSLIPARHRTETRAPTSPPGVGDDSPRLASASVRRRLFQPTFSWLCLVHVRRSDPWIYSGDEERTGRLLIARREGEALCSSGCKRAPYRENHSYCSQLDHVKRRRTMFGWERARQFRVLSALVVGSIVCCAKRFVVLSHSSIPPVKVIARVHLSGS